MPAQTPTSVPFWDFALAAVRSAWAALESLFKGPFAGVVGGALAFFVLDMGYRRLRDQRDLARGLAAELENTADRVESYLKDAEPNEVGGYVHFPAPVFEAVASRLGELRADDIAHVTKIYGFLADYNRMPSVWADRARRAQEMHPGHLQAAELNDLVEAAHEFHRVLTGLGGDCRRLAVYLRLAYPGLALSLVPRRTRVWIARRRGKEFAVAPATGR